MLEKTPFHVYPLGSAMIESKKKAGLPFLLYETVPSMLALFSKLFNVRLSMEETDVHLVMGIEWRMEIFGRKKTI